MQFECTQWPLNTVPAAAGALKAYYTALAESAHCSSSLQWEGLGPYEHTDTHVHSTEAL